MHFLINPIFFVIHGAVTKEQYNEITGEYLREYIKRY
ncbi:XkdX family protein [Mammaliicoccus fleurettii]